MDAQDKRIEKILGSECERNSENALKYLDHLQKNTKAFCILTGVEDFPWEEPYVMGGRSQKEYEKLKKNNPSHTDQFELIELLPPENDENEIIGNPFSPMSNFAIDVPIPNIYAAFLISVVDCFAF
ncbi:MAG: hypothetical protein DRG80_04600 [Deltaproteobacteria bacterium]|nr:MAG: hypothetical protein DRG80_04600 [Deltaproteobacteria bacterium]